MTFCGLQVERMPKRKALSGRKSSGGDGGPRPRGNPAVTNGKKPGGRQVAFSLADDHIDDDSLGNEEDAIGRAEEEEEEEEAKETAEEKRVR